MVGYTPCSVSGCDDRTSSRHAFPNPSKQWNRFHQWVKATGNPKLTTMDPNRVYRSYRVCHRHFTDADKTTNMYITKTCVPSLYMPDVPEETMPDPLALPTSSSFDDNNDESSPPTKVRILSAIDLPPKAICTQDITYSPLEEYEESTPTESISTDEINKMLYYWYEFQSLVTKFHPNKTEINKICEMVEDKCLNHFKNIAIKREF